MVLCEEIYIGHPATVSASQRAAIDAPSRRCALSDLMIVSGSCRALSPARFDPVLAPYGISALLACRDPEGRLRVTARINLEKNHTLVSSCDTWHPFHAVHCCVLLPRVLRLCFPNGDTFHDGD